MSKADINPPKFPSKVITWFCGEFEAEDILGDMDEMFIQNLKTHSVPKSKFIYWKQFISLLFSRALFYRRRNRTSFSSGNPFAGTYVLGNYLKVASRNLIKHKFFTVIDILALSAGMSIGLLALSAYLDVLETDNFHQHQNSVYRVLSEVNDSEGNRTYASSSLPLADALKEEFSGINDVTRFYSGLNHNIIKDEISIPVFTYYTEPSFFNLFSFELIQGSKESALQNPFSVVLTEATAEKIFGESDPLGKVIEINTLGEFSVTGIIKDHPRTHLLFEALISFETLYSIKNTNSEIARELTNWGPFTDFYTYLKIDNPDEAKNLDNAINRLIDQNDPEMAGVNYTLQELSDIPKRDYYNEIGLVWGSVPIAIFFSLSLLILIPACLNYTNISIARAVKRGKEIGLRKVVGGSKNQIFMQFIVETILISSIALLGSVYIFYLIREEFLSMIVQGRRTFDLEITLQSIIVFILFGLFTGSLAGFIPAMYFSKLNPIETLRNSSSSGKLSKMKIKKGLLISQFAISLFFILGVSIIIKQYKYALNLDLGFNKENILDVELRGVDPELLKTELDKIPEIKSVSMSSDIPGVWYVGSTWIEYSQNDSLEISQMFVDHNFINNMEIELIAGKGFPDHPGSKEEFIIVNQEFVKKLGFNNPIDALDKTVVLENDLEVRIRGVVEDFNYHLVRDKIESFFLRSNPEYYRYANLRIQTSDISSTISKIESAWKIVAQDKKFEASFLKHELEDALVSFVTMVKIFGFLGFLAITISCLGLLAIVVQTSELRVKEMGIRKVLGANSANIAYILSSSYLKILMISTLITVPVAYFAFDKLFLRVYYYRDNIGFLEITTGVVVMIILGAIVIGSQTLNIARTNPVESLKYE